MARILFVTQYYPPEVGAAQTRISETAAGLVRRGHAVTVLTTLPNYPSGVVPPEYRHGRNRREAHDGVRIVRVWSVTSPNKGFLRRVLAQLSFGFLAAPLGSRAMGKQDVIIVVSPPLFSSIAGRTLAARKRCPYVFNVADIWPESAVQMGALHNKLFIWLSERLEWTTYKRAGAIWAVTDGIRNTLVQRGVPGEKAFVLVSGVDTRRFQPLDRQQARAQLGWENRFTVVYAGTIGLAQGLATVLDTADLLRAHPDVQFKLVGDGAARANLAAEAARRGLNNLTFTGALPSEAMPAVLAASDAVLVSLRNLPVFHGALPTKMYEAMACARPVLLAVDGEARQLAEQKAQAALFVEPENPRAWANAIVQLQQHPQLAGKLAANGRAFAEAFLDRERMLASLEQHLLSLIPHKVAHEIKKLTEAAHTGSQR